MRSFPFDSVDVIYGEDGLPIFDRDYTAEDLREQYETFFTNGVFINSQDSFVVTPDDGMNVNVSPGKCCIKGTIGWEKVSRTLAVQSSTSQDRIDTVVLRFNDNIDVRNIDLYIKNGTAANNPVRPTLTRSETVYELGIADLFIAKNTSTISSARITDTRLDTNRCGVVSALVPVDTTTFYNQLQAAVDRAIELADAALDGSLVGQLQAEIDVVDVKATNAQTTANGKVSKSSVGAVEKMYGNYDIQGSLDVDTLSGENASFTGNLHVSGKITSGVPMYHVQKVGGPVGIAPSSIDTETYKVGIPVVAGYTPVGVVGSRADSQYIFLPVWYVTSASGSYYVNYRVHNWSNQTVSTNIWFEVLYIRTS